MSDEETAAMIDIMFNLDIAQDQLADHLHFSRVIGNLIRDMHAILQNYK